LDGYVLQENAHFSSDRMAELSSVSYAAVYRMWTGFNRDASLALVLMYPSGSASFIQMAVSMGQLLQNFTLDADDPVRIKTFMLVVLSLLIPAMRKRAKVTHSCATLLLKVHVRFLSR
jgi:hypothetical protein